MGHGLQKLVSPKIAPKFLAANGPRGTGGFFDQMGMRPGVLLAVFAGLGELVGGFSIATGLLTPIGTAMLAAVMTVAILKVHLSKGIRSSAGGFEFPTLTRCAPASASSAIVKSGFASTFTGCEAASQTVRTSSSVRSPGA